MSIRAASVALLAAACLLALTSCSAFDVTTTSPFSGKEVTALQLAAEASRFDQERQAAAAREKAEAESTLRTLRLNASIEARRISTAGTNALADLQERTAAEAQAAVDRVLTSQTARDAEVAAIQSRIDLAAQDLERKQQQRLAVWQAVQSIPGAAGIPGFGAIQAIGGLLLAGGVGAGAVQLTKRPLKQQIAATQEQAQTIYRSAERVVDSIDVLREASPEVAAAMQKHAMLLDEWQGKEGKALVDALQKGEKLTPKVAAA